MLTPISVPNNISPGDGDHYPFEGLFIKSNEEIEISRAGEIPDEFYYGHGKLLLSGEYFALIGAKCLAIPTILGQGLSISFSRPSHLETGPYLYWQAFSPDYQISHNTHKHDANNLWFEIRFELWHFDFLDENLQKISPEQVAKHPFASEVLTLQKILRQARKQNPHFLRDEMNVHAKTYLTFPKDFGLGSSSTLIHVVAAFARTGPFELLFNTLGGSGYDVACADAWGPIIFQKKFDEGREGASWSHVEFDPPFKKYLYFVHLGKKAKTNQATKYFDQFLEDNLERMLKGRNQISELTEKMSKTESIAEFQELVELHEKITSTYLSMPTIKESTFKDFDGAIKSLGAWGGDFILVVPNLCKYTESETQISQEQLDRKIKEYFYPKGHTAIFRYEELALCKATSINYFGLHNNIQNENQNLVVNTQNKKVKKGNGDVYLQTHHPVKTLYQNIVSSGNDNSSTHNHSTYHTHTKH